MKTGRLKKQLVICRLILESMKPCRRHAVNKRDSGALSATYTGQVATLDEQQVSGLADDQKKPSV